MSACGMTTVGGHPVPAIPLGPTSSRDTIDGLPAALALFFMGTEAEVAKAASGGMAMAETGVLAPRVRTH